VQPHIEQNAIDHASGFLPDARLRGPPAALHFGEASVSLISSKTLVPQPLQDYFIRALDLIRRHTPSGAETSEYKSLIEQLSVDAAFQPLIPYFIRTARDLISATTRGVPQLMAALNVCRALFQNPNLDSEAHLLSFVSIALTLMIATPLGEDPLDELCAVRDAAADFLGLLVNGSQASYPDLRLRTARHLLAIVLDERSVAASQYGAAAGLMMVCSDFVKEMLIPHLPAMLEKLRVGLVATEPAKRLQARHLYGVLLRICGICLHRDGEFGEEAAAVYDHVRAFFGNDLFEFTGVS
jgi:hypothetical protein